MFPLRIGWVILGVFILIALAASATVVLAPNAMTGLGWIPVFAAPAPPPPGPVFLLADGGADRAPRKIKDVPAVYPEDAKRARVEGLVILEIHVDAQGHVTDASIVRSVPMLDQAAVDAVLQWEYEPVMLNGAAVPTILTVTVNFTLKKDGSQ